jgi:hypothetical protein
MPRTRRTSPEDQRWIEEEMAGCHFGDQRLKPRAATVVGQIFGKMGESIPAACQDSANTKAAYRFFDNESVSEEQILSGHFQATKERIAASDEPVLYLHDTTEHCFKREAGVMGRDGKRNKITARRILMHSSLAITPEGQPLGVAAIKFWERDAVPKKRRKKRTLYDNVPIEEKKSFRWLENLREATARSSDPAASVHIGDRESDIYELFSLADELGTHFLVRSSSERLTQKEGVTISEEMQNAPVNGVHAVKFRDSNGAKHEALLEIKFREIEVPPPKTKQSRYSPLVLTVIYAVEKAAPGGREPIVWKLLTSLPVRTLAEAIEKLKWYAMRWKIEVFHKVLKSGCRTEESELRTADRLTNFIAICCIVAWRVFWLTMIRRTAPDAPASVALTDTEQNLLDRLFPDPSPREGPRTISDYVLKIAKLGGYLARVKDRPPGNQVIWRGLRRLADIEIGFLAALKTCG